MPPLPNVPSVLKYQFTWTAEGDPAAMTVHHFKYSGGPPSPSDLNTMAASAVAAADTRFAAFMRVPSGMSLCQITDLTSAGSAQGEGGSPWSGTSTNDNVPPGSSALVNHLIARRYRGGKPRTYLPIGTASDITSAGLWNGSSVAAWLTAWNNFVTDVLGSGSGCTVTNIVNVGYYHGFTVVTSPTTGRARNVPTLLATPHVDNIIGNRIPEQIGMQRRRNRDA